MQDILLGKISHCARYGAGQDIASENNRTVQDIVLGQISQWILSCER